MASGGQGAAFTTFIATAVTLSLLMFALAILVGAAQQRTVDALKASTAYVKRWGGVVLVIVGLWLLIITIWADFFARYFPV